jgi:hypothetical protein
VSLRQAIKDISASYDTLVDLLESIAGFLSRLDDYTKCPPTMIMAEIIVKIMVELLSTLAVVTKQIMQGRPSESIPTTSRHFLAQCKQRNLSRSF